MKQTIVFPKETQKEFIQVLRKRVRGYFKENNISKHSNHRMVIKTIAMMCIYFVPYLLMLTGVITATWMIAIAWVLMGLGMAGLGLSVMHDANHGAYFQNPTYNRWMGNIITFLGGTSSNWRIQHNVLHHSYTNIHQHDEDIDPGNVIRLDPHQERRSFHKYQHIYAWFLYSLMTIMWSTTKDFKQLFRYKREDLLKTQKRSFRFRLTELIFSKIFYYAYVLVLPLLLLPIPWWLTIIFYVMMHLIAGFILAIVFQPAHVMPQTAYPLPDESGKMDNNWAIHQLLTTTNFATGSKWFSWYVGGLNFQIEHHLFPNICHVHYKRISEIVKKTTAEFNLPYYSQPTFAKALVQHGKMLNRLGTMDVV